MLYIFFQTDIPMCFTLYFNLCSNLSKILSMVFGKDQYSFISKCTYRSYRAVLHIYIIIFCWTHLTCRKIIWPQMCEYPWKFPLYIDPFVCPYTNTTQFWLLSFFLSLEIWQSEFFNFVLIQICLTSLSSLRSHICFTIRLSIFIQSLLAFCL